MKYLGKTTVRGTGEQQQMAGYEAFAALLWVMGKRQFSASSGLSEAMKAPELDSKTDGRWEFVGVGYGIVPGSYSREHANELMKHLTGSVWQPPPSRAIRGLKRQTSL